KSPTGYASVRGLDLVRLHELRDQGIELARTPHLGDEAVDVIAHLGVALLVPVADFAGAYVERLVVTRNDPDLVAEGVERDRRLDRRVEDHGVRASSDDLLNEISGG